MGPQSDEILKRLRGAAEYRREFGPIEAADIFDRAAEEIERLISESGRYRDALTREQRTCELLASRLSVLAAYSASLAKGYSEPFAEVVLRTVDEAQASLDAYNESHPLAAVVSPTQPEAATPAEPCT